MMYIATAYTGKNTKQKIWYKQLSVETKINNQEVKKFLQDSRIITLVAILPVIEIVRHLRTRYSARERYKRK